MGKILTIDLMKYNKVGGILKSYIDKEMPEVMITSPKKSPTQLKEGTISYSYILIEKNNAENQVYFYIKENQYNGQLDLRMKRYSGENKREENRFNINGSELKELMFEMWFEINTSINFDEEIQEDIFANHVAIDKTKPTGFGNNPFSL